MEKLTKVNDFAMLDYQKKKKRNKVLYSAWMLLFLFLVSLVLVFRIVETVPKARDVLKNKDSSVAELDSLRERQTNLLAQIERLNTPKGVEEDIREKFRLAKEGEGLIVIVDEDTSKDGAKAASGQGIKGFLKSLFTRD